MPAKRHECHFCHKQFLSPAAVKIHQVVHTGEKPFECVDCGMKFNVKSNLYAHHRSKHTSQRPKISRNKPRNLGHKAGKSAGPVVDKSRTVTPNTGRKRSKTAPPKRSRQEEEDSEAMSDDYDSEQQRETGSESVVASIQINALDTQETGNNGNIDEVINLFESNEDRTEEKPRLMLAPLPKNCKINTPLIKSTPFRIKIEQNIPIVQEVGDLMPHMDLSTSSFPPSAPQQAIYDMDLDSHVGSVSNEPPQFSFEEDSRQISHQILRVAANSTKERQDCFRQLMFATVFAFESSPTCTNVEEFFRMMGERYAKE